MTDPRASAQKTDLQRLAVQVDTRQTDPVPQANQQLALFQCQNVGTLLMRDKLFAYPRGSAESVGSVFQRLSILEHTPIVGPAASLQQQQQQLEHGTGGSHRTAQISKRRDRPAVLFFLVSYR